MSKNVKWWGPLLLALAACSDAPTAIVADGSQAADRAKTPALVSGVTVAMSNLDSPRGLAFGPEGALYVAEAGTAEINGPCTPVLRGQNCYSGTGAVSRLWKGRQARVVSGLPSVYNPIAGDIIGPNDISFQGRGGGFVSIGWGGPPAARAGLGSIGFDFGTLIKLAPSGHWRVVADVAAYEGDHNPAGGPVDSNPYGVLAEAGKRFVTDAGGNSLLEVAANGEVSLVATFPSTPAPPPFGQSEAVPTEVKRGPDGALYVSTLSGVPFLAGAAAIYRVVPGQAPQVYTGGFKTITDFDWGPDGSLYVVQFASSPVFFGGPGLLIRVAPDGTRTTISSALTNPTGVAVGSDGAVYVSNKGNLAGVGEVLRIVP